MDRQTLEVHNGMLRIKALDKVPRPTEGATLADLTACVQRIVDALKGSRT